MDNNIFSITEQKRFLEELRQFDFISQFAQFNFDIKPNDYSHQQSPKTDDTFIGNVTNPPTKGEEIDANLERNAGGGR